MLLIAKKGCVMTISVEERSDYRSNVHCPFCGKLIVDVERGEDVNPCEHTLFVAHDEGLSFVILEQRKFRHSTRSRCR